ncbi:hypothetical protein GE061_007516 [Apolygus lucorum]|uniref:Peptidase S1 domain-containing protein n=1 Tax=Apolygus lucorum TaxID=248454 RepID=A0A8S9WRD5_APOLU|nr:hypothetical protein GE061_007516 [Apolygus lucorum]
MSVTPFILLALIYKICEVQSHEYYKAGFDYPYEFLDDEERSFREEFGREKRSNHPNCPGEILRINNGSAARENQFPFVVALMRWETYPKITDQFCVGTLLTLSFVLSACHCLVEGEIKYPHTVVEPPSIDILAGAVDLLSYTQDRKKVEGCGQVREAWDIFIHPKCSYQNNELVKDFGLIKTKTPFISTPQGCMKPKHFPADQPDHREVVNNMTENEEFCVTMGWGLDAEGFASSWLKTMSMTLKPAKWCKEKILDVTKDQVGGPDIFQSDANICALGCEEGETICMGDSGGPLLCGPSREFVGVASFGPGNASCGNDTIPFVFGRIDGHEYWIWAKIHNESKHDSASILNFHARSMVIMAMVLVIKDTLIL